MADQEARKIEMIPETEQDENTAMNLEIDPEMDRDMLSLQAELDRMASDVPEMPESFSRGWREAIRREAQAREINSEISKEEASEEEKTTVPEVRTQEMPQTDVARKAASTNPVSPAGRKILALRRWGQIAAVFLFLLGGTLMGWDTIRLTQVSDTAAVTAIQESAEEDVILEEAYEVDAAVYDAEEEDSGDTAGEVLYAAAKSPEKSEVAGESFDTAAEEVSYAAAKAPEELEADEESVLSAAVPSSDSGLEAAGAVPSGTTIPALSAKQQSDNLYAGAWEGSSLRKAEENLTEQQQKAESAQAAAKKIRESLGAGESKSDGTRPWLRILGLVLVLASLVLELMIWLKRKK